MGTKHELLGSFAQKVREKYGEATITTANRVEYEDVPRLRLGSLSFDFATGGGIPLGKVTMFYGHKSSGKSTHVYRAIGRAQMLCRNCLRPNYELDVVEIDYGSDGAPDGYPTHEAKGYCDCVKTGLCEPRKREGESQSDFLKRHKDMMENSYEEFMCVLLDPERSLDPVWADCLGIDRRRLYRVIPGTAEEAIDLSDALLRTGIVDLMAIDSLAVMTPSKEIEDSAENWQQGLQARLLNKAVRKWTSAINDVARETGHVPTMLLINQLRQKIGVMFGSPDTVPGGMGQGFFTALEIKCWASGIENETIELGSKKDKITRSYAIRLNFKCEKNKTAPPKQEGSFRMFLVDEEAMSKGSIDEVDYVFKTALKLGMVEKHGAAKYTCQGEIFQSQSAVKAWLREDTKVFDGLKNAILNFLLGHTPDGPVSPDTDSVAINAQSVAHGVDE
jgi:protein RecA